MPTYLYETVCDDENEIIRFEVTQRISDPPLTEHPETGAPVRRLVTAPAFLRSASGAGQKDVLSKDNLEKHGFLRYENSADGVYDRTAGTPGPERIVK